MTEAAPAGPGGPSVARCLLCDAEAPLTRRNGYFPPGWAVRDPGSRWYCPAHVSQAPKRDDGARPARVARPARSVEDLAAYVHSADPPSALVACALSARRRRGWYIDPATPPRWAATAKETPDGWAVAAYALTPGGVFSAPGVPAASGLLPPGESWPPAAEVRSALWPTAATDSAPAPVDPWDEWNFLPETA